MDKYIITSMMRKPVLFNGVDKKKCPMCEETGEPKCFTIVPGFNTGVLCCRLCDDLITKNILPPYTVGEIKIYPIQVQSVFIDNGEDDYLKYEEDIKFVRSTVNYTEKGSYPNTFSMKPIKGEGYVKFLLREIKTHGEKTLTTYLSYLSKLREGRVFLIDDENTVL